MQALRRPQEKETQALPLEEPCLQKSQDDNDISSVEKCVPGTREEMGRAGVAGALARLGVCSFGGGGGGGGGWGGWGGGGGGGGGRGGGGGGGREGGG